jgi:type II secretory pathway component HofQ
MAKSKASMVRSASVPVLVAGISAGALVLVAVVQFVVAPFLAQSRIQTSSTTPPAGTSSDTATSRGQRPVKPADLTPEMKRRNFDLLASPSYRDGVRVFRGETMTINLVDADVKDVMIMFGKLTGVNFTLEPHVGGTVTVYAEDIPWDAVFTDVLSQNALQYRISGTVVQIIPKRDAKNRRVPY